MKHPRTSETLNEPGRRRTNTPRGWMRALSRFARDERGAEVMEYVLIAGLIIVGTIAAVAGFGTKVLARWTTVRNASL